MKSDRGAVALEEGKIEIAVEHACREVSVNLAYVHRLAEVFDSHLCFARVGARSLGCLVDSSDL